MVCLDVAGKAFCQYYLGKQCNILVMTLSGLTVGIGHDGMLDGFSWKIGCPIFIFSHFLLPYHYYLFGVELSYWKALG